VQQSSESLVEVSSQNIKPVPQSLYIDQTVVGQVAPQVSVKDATANPAPLGLLAFGMTTVLLNLHNAGFFALGTMILAMGIFYGGIAQIIAGIMEWKKNNTFGMTAFLSFGLFWLSLIGIQIMPTLGIGFAQEMNGIVAYLFVWGVFTLIMFFGTLKLNRALQFVFASLALLFFLLAIGDATGSSVIKTIAGYEGIICGLSAMYTGLAQILNEVNGRTVWPIWPVKK
jgi:succinate-acetate transporter protein